VKRAMRGRLRRTSLKTGDNTDQQEENHDKVLASSYLSAVYYCYRASGCESTGHCCIFRYLRCARLWECPDPNITFNSNGLFFLLINGSSVLSPSNPHTTVLSENGPFGAAPIPFAGLWSVSSVTPTFQTVFFTESGGEVSDVLEYSYSELVSSSLGFLDGVVFSDTGTPFTVAALNRTGFFATRTVAESTVPFDFSNTGITASFRSDV
jgi:hypothetical protein